ncbi:hypothetical protein CBR_g9141 [Chara braunii]|uniref:Phosphate transporter n=1 Tax=Chara braunii TaxID=69332 RepID=A0A388KNV1_CHABU|nr:hypothetical protein CBR_g9141 [Chara braunii]|eukprot:GBG71731.1 hypothetical protein CBR_g9141 [Chara braunii]
MAGTLPAKCNHHHHHHHYYPRRCCSTTGRCSSSSSQLPQSGSRFLSHHCAKGLWGPSSDVERVVRATGGEGEGLGHARTRRILTGGHVDPSDLSKRISHLHLKRRGTARGRTSHIHNHYKWQGPVAGEEKHGPLYTSPHGEQRPEQGDQTVGRRRWFSGGYSSSDGSKGRRKAGLLEVVVGAQQHKQEEEHQQEEDEEEVGAMAIGTAYAAASPAYYNRSAMKSPGLMAGARWGKKKIESLGRPAWPLGLRPVGGQNLDASRLIGQAMRGGEATAGGDRVEAQMEEAIVPPPATGSEAEGGRGNGAGTDGHLPTPEEQLLGHHQPETSVHAAVLEPTRDEGRDPGTPAEETQGSLSERSMAEAFEISPRTATLITAGIAMAALAIPLTGMIGGTVATETIRTKVLRYVTLLCGFYMAWNIGANDVANAMGTSVGSGALSLRQAVLVAAILEFSGAFLVGSHVCETMHNGILFPGELEKIPALHFCGMLSSLLAAGTWLQFASYFGLPVSTTHCIIGALVGFGLVYGGPGVVHWSSLARVVASWVISPLMGATLSFIVYKCIRKFVYSARAPGRAACRAAPLAVFAGVTSLMLTSFYHKGAFLPAVGKSAACGLLGALGISLVIQRQLGVLLKEARAMANKDNRNADPKGAGDFWSDVRGPKGVQLQLVYTVFGWLQVLSACFMSFAHGANDVSNAIGPISSALRALQGPGATSVSGVPTEILAWGGFGIVAGLMIWGYRVIATIGKKITELTPTRGFAAEFAAAVIIVIASRLGLPVSATHTLVGSVMGVGFARGLGSIRKETVKEIVASWVVTVPIGAILSVIYTFLLSRVIVTL